MGTHGGPHHESRSHFRVTRRRRITAHINSYRLCDATVRCDSLKTIHECILDHAARPFRHASVRNGRRPSATVQSLCLIPELIERFWCAGRTHRYRLLPIPLGMLPCVAGLPGVRTVRGLRGGGRCCAAAAIPGASTVCCGDSPGRRAHLLPAAALSLHGLLT